MAQTRELPLIQREALRECIDNKCIKTLLFMIESGAINIEAMFTNPVLSDDNAWFLQKIFFKMKDDLDRDEYYVGLNNLWESLLFSMLNTLHIKGLKPLPERTIECLQLIACNDLTQIEKWLDVFAQFYDKDTFIKIVNRLIIAIPDFVKNIKSLDTFHASQLDGFAFKRPLHKAGCNLLTALIFAKGKGKYHDQYVLVEDIQRLIQKYSLDVNAPNRVLKPTLSWLGGNRYEGYNPSDMTTSYATTFGRVVNFLFNLRYQDKACRFKDIVKLLLPTADVRELEKILFWYTNLYTEKTPRLIKKITEIESELCLGMRLCSHSLFTNKDLLPILQSYHELKEEKAKPIVKTSSSM